MSQPPTLSGTQLDSKPLRGCDRCGKRMVQSGGMEIRDKWLCAGCWVVWSRTKRRRPL